MAGGFLLIKIHTEGSFDPYSNRGFSQKTKEWEAGSTFPLWKDNGFTRVSQCGTVWCSVLLCVVVCCIVLQNVRPQKNFLYEKTKDLHVCCNVLQCGLTRVLSCAPVCCSVLYCVAVCQASSPYPLWNDKGLTRVLQCAAVCFSVLQCVAMCCSVLCCMKRQRTHTCVAVCYSVL